MSDMIYLLDEDDLPVCPRHGIRLATDYYPATENEPEHELGRCNLCRKVYRFEVEGANK